MHVCLRLIVVKTDIWAVLSEDAPLSSSSCFFGSKIGVYGQVVDDFLSIEKNYIWTIATSALQEVDRQLQAERARNDELQVRLQALEARIEAME